MSASLTHDRIAGTVQLDQVISIWIRQKDWRCVCVKWNRFPIKNLWLIPCLLHLWS